MSEKTAIIKEGQIIAVDSVENLSQTNAKRVTIHGINSVPENLKADSVEKTSDYVSFLYSDDIKILLETISRLPVYDITITEPTLEEIFMHYYEKEGKKI